jgi:uncharacterized membrane protein
MTVAELAQRSGRSITQLVELAFGSRAASTTTTTSRAPAAAPSGKSKGKSKGKGTKAAAPKAAAPKAAAPKAAAPKAAAPKAAPAAAPKAAGKRAAVDTRAASGRASYDDAVLAAIRSSKGKVKAADLRKKLGGSPLQIRAALHRLIEGSKIKASGQARGTAYQAA